jgi:hypothetical protein
VIKKHNLSPWQIERINNHAACGIEYAKEFKVYLEMDKFGEIWKKLRSKSYNYD